ncbi:MAG: hypothetical protein K2L64_02615, partial [Ureaplasma sp.]|nr:hypothetical protein [Ureaplasma sp.]
MSKNVILDKIYHEYKELGDEVWNEEIQPQIEELNQKNESFFQEHDFDENKKVDKILSEANHKYKKSFNHFGYWMLAIFGLFFSFILIIPFYFALKKFKSMKSRKNELFNILE